MSVDLDRVEQRTKILIPDGEMMCGSWRELADRIDTAIFNRPWRGKTEKGVWRGRDTGENWRAQGDFWGDVATNFPRFNLALKDKEHPDVLDVKLTRILDEHHLGMKRQIEDFALELSSNMSI